MFVLPNHLGIAIGEVSESPITLKALNDSIAMDSKMKYLETVTQLSEATELHIVTLVLAWLFSKYALDHWKLKRSKPMCG